MASGTGRNRSGGRVHGPGRTDRCLPLPFDRQILARNPALSRAMPFLFGPSLSERSQVVRTLHALGPTSVEGLAAALSWTPRKTERLVSTLARRSEGGVWYPPERREVRIGPPNLEAPSPPEAHGMPQATAPTPPPSPSTLSSSSPALPTRGAGVGTCPKCTGPMEMVGDGASRVCVRCGHIGLLPRAVVPSGSTNAPPPATLPGPGGDRKSQEMLAAYVTSRPIPCPRCRSPLRHEGLGTFRCGACGEAVLFPPSTASPASPPLPTVTVGRPR